MGGAKKKIKKIIPKEVKPALPALAVAFGPAALSSFAPAAASGLASLPAGVQAAILSGGTQLVTEGKIDPKQTLLAAGQAQLGSSLQTKFAGSDPKSFKGFLAKSGEFLRPGGAGETGKTLAGAEIGKTGFMEGLKAGAKSAIPETSYAVSRDIIEMNEKALRDYEAKLAEQGILAKDDRRNQIFGYFSRAGYGDDEINAMLNKYGYANGGRVGYKKAGIVTLNDLVNKTPLYDEDEEEGGAIDVSAYDKLGKISTKLDKMKEEDDDEFDGIRLMDSLQGIMSGYEMATGQPIAGARPPRTRFGLKEGGIPNAMSMRKTVAELIQAGIIDEEDVEKAVAQIKMQAMNSMKAPGFADGGIMNLGGKEMDMREGGFIPIGSKERADDVPARLSKNEFVMTADAVRGAGNGSINKGAKRMYDLMNKLESKV